MPPRSPLTLDLVLDTAVRLADEGGLPALTMRALAAELQVEAMSLYHYVSNKDALVTGILDRVTAEIALDDHPDWRAGVRTIALSTYAVLDRHPWAATPLLTGPPVPGRLRQMEALLGCLRRGGFSARATERAYHALDSHIMGATLWEIGVSAGLVEFRADPQQLIARMRLDEHPYLAEHIDLHLRESPAPADTTFTYVLELILDGLEALRGD